jgi:hypothetical protein
MAPSGLLVVGEFVPVTVGANGESGPEVKLYEKKLM